MGWGEACAALVERERVPGRLHVVAQFRVVELPLLGAVEQVQDAEVVRDTESSDGVPHAEEADRGWSVVMTLPVLRRSSIPLARGRSVAFVRRLHTLPHLVVIDA